MSVLRDPGLLRKFYEDKINLTGSETKSDMRQK